jgi:cellulose synthase/poly-beta-1,6-N-acetylglucosamine synthase-like glycosyltransferase
MAFNRYWGISRMRYFLFRFWSAIIGIFMIALSLFLQILLFLIIGIITIPMFLPQLNPLISFAALLILFNGVSCYEYFRKRRVVTLGNPVHKLAGMVTPDSSHVSMAFYLVPRGLDRVFTGTEFTG